MAFNEDDPNITVTRRIDPPLDPSLPLGPQLDAATAQERPPVDWVALFREIARRLDSMQETLDRVVAWQKAWDEASHILEEGLRKIEVTLPKPSRRPGVLLTETHSHTPASHDPGVIDLLRLHGDRSFLLDTATKTHIPGVYTEATLENGIDLKLHGVKLLYGGDLTILLHDVHVWGPSSRLVFPLVGLGVARQQLILRNVWTLKVQKSITGSEGTATFKFSSWQITE